ncbi:MAG: hypothetical protein WC554_16510 [Clostridia bacterium]
MKKVFLVLLLIIFIFGCKQNIVEPEEIINLTGEWKSTNFGITLSIFQADKYNFSGDIFVSGKFVGFFENGKLINNKFSFSIESALSYEQYLFNLTGKITDNKLETIASGSILSNNYVIGYGEIPITFVKK